jgi:hypothetical protein
MRKIKQQNGTTILKKEVPKNSGSERDSTVYKNLSEAYYQHQFKFKKWIPFYGIVEVREVKVRYRFS